MELKTEYTKTWKTILKIAGISSIIIVVLGFLEIILIFFPDGKPAESSALHWIELFQRNPFMGLRNLGLVNVFLSLFTLIVYFGFYGAQKKNPLALVVLVLGAIATASYLSVFKGLAFLEITNQYTSAISQEEKQLFENQAAFLISVGRSHCPGTFPAFFIGELSGLLTGFVMLKGKIFSKANGWLAVSGFSMMLIYEITSSFISQASGFALGLATIGGLLVLGYQILIARSLLKLAR